MTPELSHRVAVALHVLPTGRLTFRERLRIADAVAVVDSFDHLPDWVRQVVIEGETGRPRRSSAVVRKFNPREPRDPEGKWTSGAGGKLGGKLSGTTAGALIKNIHDFGGFTFDPKKGGLINVGDVQAVAVAVPGTERIVGRGANVDRDQFVKGMTETIMQYGDQLAKGAVLGGWYSDDRDAYMVELTELFADRAEAVKAGVERNQEGIFDLSNGDYIPTGGTGG